MNDHKTIIGIIGKRETQPHGELQPHGIRYLILLALLLVSSHFITCWEKKLLQPRTPSAGPYEAPTPSSDWSKTHGGNYSNPRTPQLNISAYANKQSPYVPSSHGIWPITPGFAGYLPGTPGVQPMTPEGVMSPVIGTQVAAAYQSETKLFGQILYYVLTTGLGQQTLGEEYILLRISSTASLNHWNQLIIDHIAYIISYKKYQVNDQVEEKHLYHMNYNNMIEINQITNSGIPKYRRLSECCDLTPQDKEAKLLPKLSNRRLGISFEDCDTSHAKFPHHDALVIMLKMKKFVMHTMMIDTGSGLWAAAEFTTWKQALPPIVRHSDSSTIIVFMRSEEADRLNDQPSTVVPIEYINIDGPSK
ncbi:hypothetical protein GIB67_033988, partial [Kingdonia uniflora]